MKFYLSILIELVSQWGLTYMFNAHLIANMMTIYETQVTVPQLIHAKAIKDCEEYGKKLLSYTYDKETDTISYQCFDKEVASK